MKMKFLLGLVPAVLALSACQTTPKKNVEVAPPINNNQIVEDTTLHEEIFGNTGFKGYLNNKRFFNIEPVESSAPAIGLQYKVDNKGTVNTDDDVIAIRFVAAIEANDLASTSAVWTRAMFNTDGSALKATATKASLTGYTSLASPNSSELDLGNADILTIEQFNENQGGTHYTHFVVYSMTNIPLDDYAHCYLNVYLTVNGETTSKVVSTSIDQNTQFSFANSDTGVFGVKKTSSGYEKFNNGNFYDGNEYIGQFVNISISSDESFLLVNRGVNTFSVYGYNEVHHADNSDTYFTQLSSSQFSKSKENKSYFLFLDSANGDVKAYEASEVTFYLELNNAWFDANNRFVLSIKFDEESGRALYDMTRVNDTRVYSCTFYYPVGELASNPVAFAKYSKDNLTNTWANKTGNTSDMAWPTGTNDLYILEDEIWSIYNANNYESNFTILAINGYNPNDPVEIHTPRQAEYLAYDGDYREIPTSSYPDGNAHISNPLDTTLTWDYDVPDGKTVDHFSIKYGRESDLSDGYTLVGQDDSQAMNIINPYLGVNYYQLTATFTDSSTDVSPIYYFFVDTTYPRNLNIDGMTNCRDLGGRPLEDGGTFKQGMVFRTSGRNQAGLVISEETRRELVDHLGVKNEVYIAERGSSYAVGLAGTNVQNIYMDYSATDGSSNLSRNTEPLKKFFNFLADIDNYPLFFHCKIGTDRTGLCATMLNGLLGVSENDIYQDYLFSNFGNIQGKRYIGEAAGHDNILRYTDYIKTFSGATFKNKVYNLLLAIGVSRATLDAVIANLTEGPTATGNNAGQLTAFGDQLTPSGVVMSTYDNSVYSNYPAQYYTLTNDSESVSYSFNVSEAYKGQIVAYMGNGNNSTYYYISDAIKLSLDGEPLTVKSINYKDAGMGYITTSYQRYMYYPVTICITDLSVGNHTITISGNSDSMNVAGISILNAATATCYHNLVSEVIVTPATCSSTGLKQYTCTICGETVPEVIPTTDHNFGDWEEVVAATCEHAGYYERECSACHQTEQDIIPPLGHNWGDAVARDSANENHIASTSHNCGNCGESAIRWSALDYDSTLSANPSPENNGSSVRFTSGRPENNGMAEVRGSHLVYKVNVTEAINDAGLSFRIQNTNGSGTTAPVFDKIPNDSANGYYYDGNDFIDTGKRYGLRVNGVEYFLGDDDYGNQKGVTGWFDWPVSFPVNAGVNTIDVFAYAGYRAYIYEFQLTGFSFVENNHVHTYSEWQSNADMHWKVCTGDGCIFEEGTHFQEGYHDWDWGVETVSPTCTSTGIMTYTCQTCGRTYTEVIPMAEHSWDVGVVVTEATCHSLGQIRYTCQICGATRLDDIETLSHNWDAGEVTTEATCTTDGEMTYHCQNQGCSAEKTEVIKAGHHWVSAGSLTGATKYECDRDGCDAVMLEIDANSGQYADGSSRKSGTPTGFMKLNANGNSVTYTFEYDGVDGTAKLYQKACMDSWSSSSTKNAKYTTNGTSYDSGCNFSIYYGTPTPETLVTVDSTAKNTVYSSLLANGVEDPLLPGDGSLTPYSVVADCYIGEMPIVNGTNMLKYMRNASMNMVIKSFVLVIE